MGPDIVQTANEAAGLSRPPLLILERIAAFLDNHGLGSGPVIASRVGEGGGSNFSFLIERSGDRYVLRRPPRPPLAPSAHDVVREARLQLALARVGIRVPRIRAVCEDDALLGVPFYVADYIEGFVVTDEAAARPGRRRGSPATVGRRPDRRVGRDPRSRCGQAGLGHVRPAGELPGTPGKALQAALGGQRHPRPPAGGRSGREAGRRPAGTTRARRSSTATTGSGT